MLALATTDALVLLDAPTLKHPPSSTPSCQSLIDQPTSSTWSLDNSSLFLASASAIHRYDPSTNSLHRIYSNSNSGSIISNLLARDKGNSLIFSASQSIYVLECGKKVVQTLDTHKAPVTSLALSNDGTLLASTSAGGVHVHNLTLGSHTTLRGLPAAGGSQARTCVFHAHTRTRLLLGAGRQLLVYDTTRPSGPAKVIPMNDSSVGEIAYIAVSPFSKTLVVFATDAGHLSLVDLEKDKSLIRTINVHVPVTSLKFSQDGAAVYMGTANGKLVFVDLRALDKPQKVISVSETGARVETISIQKKLRAGAESGAKTASSASIKSDIVRRAPASTASTKSLPLKTSSSRPISKTSSGNSPVSKPAREKQKTSLPSPGSIKSGTPRTPPQTKPVLAATKKAVLSPARDPHGNNKCEEGDISVCLDDFDISTGKKKKGAEGSDAVLRPPLSSISPKISGKRVGSSTLDVPSIRSSRSRSASAASRVTSTSSKAASEVISTRSTRTVSTLSSVSARSGGGSYPQAGSSISQARSPMSRHPVQPTERESLSPEPVDVPREDESRTPSPDLPDIEVDTCPLPSIRENTKPQGLNILGLGTPEVDRWIATGKGDDTWKEEGRKQGKKRKGKEKIVAFEGTERGGTREEREAPEEKDEAKENLAVQVSPRRDVGNVCGAWTASPLRHLAVDGNVGGMQSSAHELLRTIVRDVMCDFRQETRGEMMGLHLDLVRMGRGWRRELRELMGEYVGDLKELREENKRLREENERLRGGC